jgi:hypothetical protein
MGFYKQAIQAQSDADAPVIEMPKKCGHSHRTRQAAEACEAGDVGLFFIIKEKAPRPKYKSRATRCSEGCEQINFASSTLSDLASDVESFLSNQGEDDFKLEDFDIADAKSKLDAADTDRSNGLAELQSLYDEVSDIVGNYSGTSLENSQRVQTFSETESALESSIGEVENVEIPSLPDEITVETLEQFQSALEDAASELESAISEAESAEFPGMYG